MDWGELEQLCRACEGLPFLLSVRVRKKRVKTCQPTMDCVFSVKKDALPAG